MAVMTFQITGPSTGSGNGLALNRRQPSSEPMSLRPLHSLTGDVIICNIGMAFILQ